MEKMAITQERFEQIIENFSSISPILVIGDVGIDKYTFGEVKRISPEAPVSILEVTKNWFKLGLAANVGDNLISLGVKNTLCGVVGDDSDGELFLNLLEDREMKTWGITSIKNRRTTLKERVTTQSQQICRIDYEEKSTLAAEQYGLFLQRTSELAVGHSSVILQDYAKGLLNTAHTIELIKSLQKNDCFISVDPSRYTNPHIYTGVDLIKPNKDEAKQMVHALGHDTDDYKEMIKIIASELEIEKVVLTLGSEGMALMDLSFSEEVYHIPTMANEVFDVSGAGDTAISIISSSLQAGSTLIEAAFLANCASGAVVGKKGTATVSLEEIRNIYKRNFLRKDSLSIPGV